MADDGVAERVVVLVAELRLSDVKLILEKVADGFEGGEVPLFALSSTSMGGLCLREPVMVDVVVDVGFKVESLVGVATLGDFVAAAGFGDNEAEAGGGVLTAASDEDGEEENARGSLDRGVFDDEAAGVAAVLVPALEPEPATADAAATGVGVTGGTVEAILERNEVVAGSGDSLVVFV